MKTYVQPTMTQLVVAVDSMIATSPGSFQENSSGTGGSIGGFDPTNPGGAGGGSHAGGEVDARERGEQSDFGSLW